MDLPDDVRRAVAKASEFARDRLGPHSEALIARPEAQALLLSRLRAGCDLPDAVLGVVHGASATERAAADEFLAYFLADLQRGAGGLVPIGLRRYLETSDLVQSVLGDIWRELAEVRFESRARFVSFLAQRLRWKASDRRRALGGAKRALDRHVDADLRELPAFDPSAGPATAAGSREETETLILKLLRLPERDRELIRLHLLGERTEAIARRLGLAHEAARKALQRALERARALR